MKRELYNTFVLAVLAGIMIGYTHELDYNLTFDIRYRLAGLFGGEQERTLLGGEAFSNDIGLILDNSISFGIRYDF